MKRLVLGGFMQLPIVSPAPIVTTHAQAFRDLFSDHRQYENFEHYLMGLIVLAILRTFLGGYKAVIP